MVPLVENASFTRSEMPDSTPSNMPVSSDASGSGRMWAIVAWIRALTAGNAVRGAASTPREKTALRPSNHSMYAPPGQVVAVGEPLEDRRRLQLSLDLQLIAVHVSRIARYPHQDLALDQMLLILDLHSMKVEGTILQTSMDCSV
jgi:hypothetical protein